jgi:hypothetical protein
MRMVASRAKMRTKEERRRKSRLTRFDQNLLTSFGLSRLWQLVMNVFSSLLTEGPEVTAICTFRRGARLRQLWSEPLKWHTKLGTVSGKGNTGGEKEILPEISANGCRTDGDLRRCR